MISSVEKIREFMKEQGVNFLLVNSTNKYLEEYTPLEENSRYFLTDFSGSTGDVLVTFEDIYLFVDGRYHIQADLEVNHDIVSVVKLQTGQTFLEELIKKIPQGEILGIFAKKNSQTRVEYLEKNGIKLKYFNNDPLDKTIDYDSSNIVKVDGVHVEEKIQDTIAQIEALKEKVARSGEDIEKMKEQRKTANEKLSQREKDEVEEFKVMEDLKGQIVKLDVKKSKHIQ